MMVGADGKVPDHLGTYLLMREVNRWVCYDGENDDFVVG